MDMSTKMSAHWERLCELHSRTKHYLLIAEELSEDGSVFLQPMKEHRDAYDHITRAYSAEFQDALPTKESKSEYMDRNMKEAYSHEFRAFFDTADWLSFICRKYIRTMLRNQSIKNLHAFKDYQKVKALVNSMPQQIAEIRSRETVLDNKDEIPETVDPRVAEYCDILDQLIDAYILVRNEFDNA